jgi:hypothetical protein
MISTSTNMKRYRKKLPSVSIALNVEDLQISKRVNFIRENNLLNRGAKKTVTNNEMLRRGLHSLRYLNDVDEKQLLELLSQYLHSAQESPSPSNISNVKNLALAVYATMISKYGITEAKPFENIAMSLDFIDRQQSLKSSIKSDKEYHKNIKNAISEISGTVDNVFLKVANI